MGCLADIGKRFASAWKQAEVGEVVDQTQITFFVVKTMFETLPTRLDLLRYARQPGTGNVCELDQTLSRDYKKFHQDVISLQLAGLLSGVF